MAYWLMKTEPETFSWDDQLKRGAKGEPWTGVRNALAANNLQISNVNSFVRLSGGASTTISVNADGVGTDFVALATLQNVAMSSTLLNDLIAQGNLAL